MSHEDTKEAISRRPFAINRVDVVSRLSQDTFGKLLVDVSLLAPSPAFVTISKINISEEISNNLVKCAV